MRMPLEVRGLVTSQQPAACSLSDDAGTQEDHWIVSLDCVVVVRASYARSIRCMLPSGRITPSVQAVAACVGARIAFGDSSKRMAHTIRFRPVFPAESSLP